MWGTWRFRERSVAVEGATIPGMHSLDFGNTGRAREFRDARMGAIAPCDNQGRNGKSRDSSRVFNQIRSTPVAAASSVAATALICSSLSGPRERRNRNASFKFSMARRICGAVPPPWARLVSAM